MLQQTAEINEILEQLSQKTAETPQNPQQFLSFFRGLAETAENPAKTRALLLYFGGFLENRAFFLENAAKLEVFCAISAKLRTNSAETADFVESFLYFLLNLAFVRRNFSSLQDFCDISRKLRKKMLEDARFYVKFLENWQEMSQKHAFSCDFEEILCVFLRNLNKILEKSPQVLKNQAKGLKSWVFSQLYEKTRGKRAKKVLYS